MTDARRHPLRLAAWTIVMVAVAVVLAWALYQVRAGESRRMKSHGRTPVLKKPRWLCSNAKKISKDEQRFRLRDLLRYNLKTVRAYVQRQFQQLWHYTSTR